MTENVWTILGPEFGSGVRKMALIVRASFGLESAKAAFRSQLAPLGNARCDDNRGTSVIVSTCPSSVIHFNISITDW